jgi:ATPase subunit of ABC transporter with duplicated ATPase domains
MTNPTLTLDGVACVLPDGRTLFSDLHASFDTRRTGLVGRNGVGKSMLARILTGQWPPSAGRVLGEARVHYLAQEPDRRPHDTVATLAGMAPMLAALARIAEGSVDPGDYDAVGTRWDVRERLEASLVEHGLGHLRADTPARRLSGGEAGRVAFLGALLSEADVLILDEPSNHLDRDARQALIRQIDAWPGGMIVVSHDRELMRRMDRTVELSALGLRTYGGNYDFYARQSAQEQANALRELEHHKTTRRREERALREDRERAERRAARGQRGAREANQAPILLGRQKERSETTVGRVRDRQLAQRAVLDARVSEAARRVDARAAPTLRATAAQSTPFRLAMLDGVRLPHLAGPCADIDLLVTAGQRIAVTGPNGSGKSTLLRTLAGTLSPLAGERHAWVPVAYLDQQLAGVDAASPVLTLMQVANPSMDAAEARTRLSQIGLDAAAVTWPSGQLSGGQRLAAGIALAIYADPPAALLLLDEPGNHLDLASLQALEDMLREYDGGLVVVSHDEVFLERIGLTERLTATPEGWKRLRC